LHVRINARVDAIFARGLVDETRELLKRGLEQIKRRCKPSATGRWWNICTASGHWRKHRAGENPDAPICQAATDVVPRPEKSGLD